MSFGSFTTSNQIKNQGHTPNGDQITTDPRQINGVGDLLKQYDLFIFSPQNTLIRNAQTLPSGATLVPKLRQQGKRLAVLNTDESRTRDEVTLELNRLGFSFMPQKVLEPADFSQLQEKFPLIAPQHILVVCSDVISEVNLAKAHGLDSLLILPFGEGADFSLGIEPDYYAYSV
jgi:hypothetical protein